MTHMIDVSRGLFDHKERLGPAIWEFLWCIDAVTSESVDEQGIRWGFVHDGVPVKHERIASELRSSSRTVQRNMDRLKNENYIQTVRTGRGEIIKVRNNQKVVPLRHVKTGISGPPKVEFLPLPDSPKLVYLPNRDTPEMEHQEGRDMPDAAYQEGQDKTYLAYQKSRDTPDVAHLEGQDTPNMATQDPRYDTCGTSKRLIITTITQEDIIKGQIEILDAYCQLHNKLDIHVTSTEREAMGKMVSGGIPVPFTIQTMGLLYKDKQKREHARFKPPFSFQYYVDAIKAAWENVSSATESALLVQEEPVQRPQKRAPKKNKKSKREEDLEFLDKFAEEEE